MQLCNFMCGKENAGFVGCNFLKLETLSICLLLIIVWMLPKL